VEAANATASTVLLDRGEEDAELPLVCGDGMLGITPTGSGGGGGIGMPSMESPGGWVLPIAGEVGRLLIVEADIVPSIGGGDGVIVLSPEEVFPFPLPFPLPFPFPSGGDVGVVPFPACSGGGGCVMSPMGGSGGVESDNFPFPFPFPLPLPFTSGGEAVAVLLLACVGGGVWASDPEDLPLPLPFPFPSGGDSGVVPSSDGGGV
jgi:hypothetical protein